MAKQVRVLIADDHPLTRRRHQVGPGQRRRARGGRGHQRRGGIQATREITRANPAIRVLILTVEDAQAQVGDAIQAGAAGYLLKDVDAEALARAVRLAAEGCAVIHPDLTRQFVDELRPLSSGERTVTALSAREVEVLQMIANGSTNRLERIFTKLGVSDRTRAVAVALKLGILE